MRSSLLCVLFLAVPHLAWGAIAFDAASAGSAVTTQTSTHNHTFAANAVGVVCIGARDTVTAPTVRAVTVGGQPATVQRQDADTVLKSRTSVWTVSNPSSGSQAVYVELAAAPDRMLGVAVASYTGVDFIAPVEASNGANDSVGSTAVSVSVTTVSDNAFVVDCAFHGDDFTMTVGAGQTARANRTISGGGATDVQAQSEEGPVSPAGATAMTWTSTNSSLWATSAVALKPNAAASNCDRRITDAGDVRITDASDVRITEGTGGGCPAVGGAVPMRMLMGVGL